MGRGHSFLVIRQHIGSPHSGSGSTGPGPVHEFIHVGQRLKHQSSRPLLQELDNFGLKGQCRAMGHMSRYRRFLSAGSRARDMTNTPSDDETVRKAAFWLVVVFTFVVLLFLQLLSADPADGTLMFELAKTSLQVACGIVLGAFVTLAVFLFQKGWEQRRESLQLQAVQKREDLQREADNLRDERLRQDLALRSLLEETLETYNRVKRIRRILKSESGDGLISKEVYERQILDLIDLQLRFETFARTLRSIGDDRLAGHVTPWDPEDLEAMGDSEQRQYRLSDLAGLKADYDAIEIYLNSQVNEFTSRLHTLPVKDRFPLEKLADLHLFVTSTNTFRAGTSRRLSRIQRVLQTALLVPLELPTQEAGASGANRSPIHNAVPPLHHDAPQ